MDQSQRTLFLERLIVDLQPKERWYWGRKHRNVLKLLTAFSFSTGGGLLAGFYPTPAGVSVGGVLQGVGNGLSTYLYFEREHDHLIEKSAIVLLPELVRITEEIEENLEDVIKKIQTLHPHLVIQSKDSEKSILDQEEDLPSCSER